MSVSKLKDLSALSDNLLSLQPHEGYLEAADALANLRGAQSIVASVADQYARSYASVQSVQYDTDGNIEDVTTNDALSIPRNVFRVAITNLIEWRDKLTSKLGLLGTVPVSRASVATYPRYSGEAGKYTATTNGISFIPYTNPEIWVPGNTTARIALGSHFLIEESIRSSKSTSLTLDASPSFMYTFTPMVSASSSETSYPIFQMLVTRKSSSGFEHKLLATGAVLPEVCDIYQSTWTEGQWSMQLPTLTKSGVIYREDYPALWTAASRDSLKAFNTIIQLFVKLALGPDYKYTWGPDPMGFNWTQESAQAYKIESSEAGRLESRVLTPNATASATTDLTGFVPDISDTIAILNSLA